jgi:hypothetical protein
MPQSGARDAAKQLNARLMQACSVRELFNLVIEHGQSASMDGINATAAMLRLAKVGAAPFTHLLKQPLPPAFAPAEICGRGYNSLSLHLFCRC